MRQDSDFYKKFEPLQDKYSEMRTLKKFSMDVVNELLYKRDQENMELFKSYYYNSSDKFKETVDKLYDMYIVDKLGDNLDKLVKNFSIAFKDNIYKKCEVMYKDRNYKITRTGIGTSTWDKYFNNYTMDKYLVIKMMGVLQENKDMIRDYIASTRKDCYDSICEVIDDIDINVNYELVDRYCLYFRCQEVDVYGEKKQIINDVDIHSWDSLKMAEDIENLVKRDNEEDYRYIIAAILTFGKLTENLHKSVDKAYKFNKSLEDINNRLGVIADSIKFIDSM